MADQPSLRRRFQFRLRTLMIVVTLLVVPLGYVGWQAKVAWDRETFLENQSPDVTQPPSESERRVRQFRLRALLIGVTLLNVPLEYVSQQWHVAAKRETMRERITALGGGNNIKGTGRNMWCIGMEEYQAEHIPLIRRWLGDRAHPSFYIPNETLDVDIRTIEEAFPEAAIIKVKRSTIDQGF